MFLSDAKGAPRFLRYDGLPTWVYSCSITDLKDGDSRELPTEVLDIVQKYANGEIEVVFCPATKGTKEGFVLRPCVPKQPVFSMEGSKTNVKATVEAIPIADSGGRDSGRNIVHGDDINSTTPKRGPGRPRSKPGS